MSAAVTQTKRRRPVALWSPALIASARRAALHLHEGRPKSWWEKAPEGFLERRTTVRRVTCAECGRSILKGTLALYGFSGDTGRTPYPRYLCIERCTAACPDCNFFPCRCSRLRFAVRPESPNPDALAFCGLWHPERLSLEDIRELSRLLLSQGKARGAA